MGAEYGRGSFAEMIAVVYITTESPELDKPFDYSVPKELEDKLCVGMRVKVPFGGGNIPKEAYITELKNESDYPQLKSVKAVADAIPVLTAAAMELCFFMRERYFCTFSQAARVMLPPGINMKFEEWISLCPLYEARISLCKSVSQKNLIRFLEDNDGCAEFSQIRAALGNGARTVISSLVKKQICDKSYVDKRKNNPRFVRVASLCRGVDAYGEAQALERRAPIQAEILRTLSSGEEILVSDLVAMHNGARNAVEALCVKGLISSYDVQMLRNPLGGKKQKQYAAAKLTEEQKNAVAVVEKKKEGTFLIHGVTGSGKTEVFLTLAEKYIKCGKSAIVLVPEISLTPQMTNRFYNRFGDNVAVLHSALSLGERLDEWNRIRGGQAKVIVGARSAVFAPASNVGIIIIDEEHEQSYKSESNPRYHARDIARFLADKHKCPLVLASATPSIESYYKACNGEYTLAELLHRYNNNPMPAVEIADMREELKSGNKTVLSRSLARQIYDNIKNKEQTILFLNRRGYSTFVSCRDCGYVFSCPACSISLTYHKKDNALICHYCGYTREIPQSCPSCAGVRIKDFGKGTQKAQEQIAQIFKSSSIIRMDSDTTSGKNSHEKLLDSFVNNNIDILLGTQMVTKGLDFANVTLVGVLAADASLGSDDFRAQERTFDLITQVCGRSGRGEKPGRCVVQTYDPENRTLILAAKQNYKAFYKEEIAFRKAFEYPPFCDIVNITVSSESREKADVYSKKIASALRVACRDEQYTLYGPSESPIAKLQNRYRFRILLKCNANNDFTAVLRETVFSKSMKKQGDVSVAVDINPYNMN